MKMALSIMNHLMLESKELRVPFMLFDGLLLYALRRWDSRLQQEKSAIISEKELRELESQKKADLADKSALRVQRKGRKQHSKYGGSKQQHRAAHIAHHNIQQPDKNKKIR